MDSKNSYVGSILMFLNMFVLIVAMILLMIVGAYHLLFEEPERLPYKAVVYDRSNKAIVSYEAVCVRLKMGHYISMMLLSWRGKM